MKQSKLGTPNPKAPFETVIIIGSSMGGLFSAAALCHHAKKVIIIEKAAPNPEGSLVPQGKAIHLFMKRGLDIMEKMLPGIGRNLWISFNNILGQEFDEKGCGTVNWGTESNWYSLGGKRISCEALATSAQRRYFINLVNLTFQKEVGWRKNSEQKSLRFLTSKSDTNQKLKDLSTNQKGNKSLELTTWIKSTTKK